MRVQRLHGGSAKTRVEFLLQSHESSPGEEGIHRVKKKFTGVKKESTAVWEPAYSPSPIVRVISPRPHGR